MHVDGDPHHQPLLPDHYLPSVMARLLCMAANTKGWQSHFFTVVTSMRVFHNLLSGWEAYHPKIDISIDTFYGYGNEIVSSSNLHRRMFMLAVLPLCATSLAIYEWADLAHELLLESSF
ncbi:hypothetical protein VNO78_19915 [Psophocarpus tetragonolobus]|uniref:Uncharacterized protein n=1 Tax=Psophocarpus tetragonolobus TaxID=3891 RepID=A0AAN9S9Z4_PSOTE